MIWGIIIGIIVGYVFRSPIDKGVKKVMKMITDNRKGGDGGTY